MSEKRTENKLHARLCEQAERYEDMVKIMKGMIKEADQPLDEDERNLFSVAYKNVVGARRASWRVISAREAEEENEKFKVVCENMRKRVEDELRGSCNEVLGLIDNNLLKKDLGVQDQIFFLKMKGDYIRYMIEIAGDSPDRMPLVNSSKEAYDAAMKLAKDKLQPASPIRLGLALNFSVFYYEIMGDSQGACLLAKESFGDALADIEKVEEDTYRDSSLIMQLLRDNLTLWTSDEEGVQDVAD